MKRLELKRRCHLCDTPTINKYCENKSCAENKRDERVLETIHINFTESDILELHTKFSLLEDNNDLVYDWVFQTETGQTINTIITVGNDG